jgi:hypothetical protein
MKTSLKDQELEQAIHDTYRLWNEGKRQELDALFERMGPAGFTIQYVGSPVVDGPAAMEEMWRQYGGKCSTEALEVIVNGTEGAAYVANHLRTETGVTILPSLETYNLEDGRLTIRYFHKTAE